MSALNSRHVFTDEQLSQYLQLLFGGSHELSSLPALKKAITCDPLTTIGILQTQHLAAIPFSTIGFNYESAKIPIASLDPQDVFEKVVVKKQGGFCLEMNTFFSAVLRSLGVENYLTGGRISYVVGNTVATIKRDSKGFDGWQHMLIIATIGGKKYNIDVGFTTFGITKPLPLVENVTMPCIPGLEARHVKQTMAQSVTDQSVWVFETRNTHSNEWSPGYCFTEVEWLPQDFDAMNLQLSADPISWTTYTLLVTKLLMKEDQVEGILTLFNTFVQRRVGGGEAELLEVLGSEAERVKALEKYFGVVLSEEQINGITGRVTEVKADPKSE